MLDKPDFADQDHNGRPAAAGVPASRNRSRGAAPLAPREGDRSTFSDDISLAKHDFSPKNGPVPNRPVNDYKRPWQGAKFSVYNRWRPRSKRHLAALFRCEPLFLEQA